MEKIVSSGVRAERFTPVMVYSKQASFIYYRKCIWRIDVHHIQHPYLDIFQSCCKSARQLTMVMKWQILSVTNNAYHSRVQLPSINGSHVHDISDIGPADAHTIHV